MPRKHSLNSIKTKTKKKGGKPQTAFRLHAITRLKDKHSYLFLRSSLPYYFSTCYLPNSLTTFMICLPKASASSIVAASLYTRIIGSVLDLRR